MSKNDEATLRATAYIDDVKAVAASLGYETAADSAEAYEQAVQTAALPVAELLDR